MQRKKCFLAGASSLILTAVYMAAGGFPGNSGAEALRLLCDGFAVPGLLCLLLGSLTAVRRAGALDGLGYLLKTGASVLIPGGHSRESYGSYKQRRSLKAVPHYGHWLMVGAGDLAAAAVFLALYGAI